MTNRLTRRGMIAGSAALIPSLTHAQGKAQLGIPRSVISNPAREFGPRAQPSISPDPDVLRIDSGFNNFLIGQEVIHRVATGFHFTEGPAWSSEGQYAIFSDVKNDTIYRYLWDNGQVTAFRKPSFNSNGNSFECKPLNSPNDLAPHPDGSVWFTDPIYGGVLAEGHPDEGEGPMNPGGT